MFLHECVEINDEVFSGILPWPIIDDIRFDVSSFFVIRLWTFKQQIKVFCANASFNQISAMHFAN